MATVQPPSLAAAVSNAGALGTIAGAALSADELRAAIREVRAATDGAVRRQPLRAAVPPRGRARGRARGAAGGLQLHVRARRPGAAAGARHRGRRARRRRRRRRRSLESAGVDAVVAQGAEAGGHRGTFLGSFEDGLVPLDELLASIDVAVPGDRGGRDRRRRRRSGAALELGAAGAQLGTAFLFTPECGRPREHLDALRTYDTVVTRRVHGPAACAPRARRARRADARGAAAVPASSAPSRRSAARSTWAAPARGRRASCRSPSSCERSSPRPD